MTGIPMPDHRWLFYAQPSAVIDGDTVDLRFDQGLRNQRIERVRLLGPNTPEVRGPTRPAGLAAKAYTEAWLTECVGEWPLLVETSKADAFGRWLAVIWRVVDGRCLNEDVIVAGHAVLWERA
jgi:endonuclease YncB( thermonuclease family)